MIFLYAIEPVADGNCWMSIDYPCFDPIINADLPQSLDLENRRMYNEMMDRSNRFL